MRRYPHVQVEACRSVPQHKNFFQGTAHACPRPWRCGQGPGDGGGACRAVGPLHMQTASGGSPTTRICSSRRGARSPEFALLSALCPSALPCHAVRCQGPLGFPAGVMAPAPEQVRPAGPQALQWSTVLPRALNACGRSVPSSVDDAVVSHKPPLLPASFPLGMPQFRPGVEDGPVLCFEGSKGLRQGRVMGCGHCQEARRPRAAGRPVRSPALRPCVTPAPPFPLRLGSRPFEALA